MKVFRVNPRAFLPELAHVGEDNAYDLFLVEDATLRIGLIEVLSIGIAAQQDDCGFLIVGRSSLTQRGVFVLPSIVDMGYRGEWHVPILYVGSGLSYYLERGDRIAQALPVRSLTRQVVEVKSLSGLGSSKRGQKAFGSSGR